MVTTMDPASQPAAQSTKPRYRRRATWIGLAVLAVLAATVMLLLARASILSAFQDDACRTIGLTLAGQIEAGAPVTPELVRSTITDLIRASVIHGSVDPSGAPSDLHGKPFQVTITPASVQVSTERSLQHPFRSQVTVPIGTD